MANTAGVNDSFFLRDYMNAFGTQSSGDLLVPVTGGIPQPGDLFNPVKEGLPQGFLTSNAGDVQLGVYDLLSRLREGDQRQPGRFFPERKIVEEDGIVEAFVFRKPSVGGQDLCLTNIVRKSGGQSVDILSPKDRKKVNLICGLPFDKYKILDVTELSQRGAIFQRNAVVGELEATNPDVNTIQFRMTLQGLGKLLTGDQGEFGQRPDFSLFQGGIQVTLNGVLAWACGLMLSQYPEAQHPVMRIIDNSSSNTTDVDLNKDGFANVLAPLVEFALARDKKGITLFFYGDPSPRRCLGTVDLSYGAFILNFENPTQRGIWPLTEVVTRELYDPLLAFIREGEPVSTEME